jgi:hypothetical protein
VAWRYAKLPLNVFLKWLDKWISMLKKKALADVQPAVVGQSELVEYAQRIKNRLSAGDSSPGKINPGLNNKKH